MAYEQCDFNGENLPDGEDRGIESIGFWLNKSGDEDIVHFHAHIAEVEDTIDASESDFPIFDCNFTVQQFKSLTKMFLRFDELISP